MSGWSEGDRLNALSLAGAWYATARAKCPSFAQALAAVDALRHIVLATHDCERECHCLDNAKVLTEEVVARIEIEQVTSGHPPFTAPGGRS